MGLFRLRISHSPLLLLLVLCCFTKYQVHAKVFHLKDYGAVEGGKVDNSKALLKAWADACSWKGDVQLEIPNGIYLVQQPVAMKGPCNGPVRFRNKGTLRAPSNLSGTNKFISFEYVDGLSIDGGGSIDGQGRPKQGSPDLPTLLRFSFVTNSKIEHQTLMNSQSTHFHLFACNNTEIRQISISSPEDSPNTDGIKLGKCQGINIMDSHIASGDDCVALITGTKNVSVSGVTCGPGHGISIGSLGGSPDESVEQVTVRNCTLIGTSNGVRIKTKATGKPGLVSNIVFQDIILVNGVDNPIIIDQNYCPSKDCGNQRTSGVQVSDVKYINIQGTSRANVAVNLDCSRSKPCQRVELKDINIKYEGPAGGSTVSKCNYVSGDASGVQVPKSCLR